MGSEKNIAMDSVNLILVQSQGREKFRVSKHDVTVQRLAQLFHYEENSIFVTDQETDQVVFPGPDGCFRIREGSTLVVDGEITASVHAGAPSSTAIRSSSFGWSHTPSTSLVDISKRPSASYHGPFSSSWSSSNPPRAAKTAKEQPEKDQTRRFVFQLVKFDGKRKSSGGRNFSLLQTFSLKVPITQLTTDGLTRLGTPLGRFPDQ